MNTLRAFTAATLICLAVASGATAYADSRIVTGELVVLDGSHSRFRIVDQPGSFAAPAGISLEELDGKAVRVELSKSGQVLSITEKTIPIQPIEHGVEEVSGELAIVDANTGKFTIVGDQRVYVAPQGVDLRPYAGRMVKVRLNDKAEVTGINLAAVSGSRSYAAVRNEACQVDGLSFADGASRCVGETGYICENGFWRSLGRTCGIDVASSSTCLIGGATVADGSSVCQQGRTLNCRRGDWVANGMACR